MSTRSTNRNGADPAGSQRSATSAARARDGAPRFVETVGPANDSFEREADRIANAVVRGPGAAGFGVAWSAASVSSVGVQRKCAECEHEEEDEKIRRAPKTADATETPAVDRPPGAADTATATGEGAASAAANAKGPPAAAVAGLLVEDTGEVSGAQMRKTEFLSALRVDVCAAADAAMAGTGRTSEGCPWVDYWLGYYADKDAPHIERALLRYAPEAAGAASARDYIGFAAARVARSVAIWAKTGEITGVPEGVPGGGAAMLGASAAGLMFKARAGGPREANPVSVRQELGAGQALPGAVRTRMESAFGANFSGVRLHDDATGNQLSERLNARAFTVGQHVACGPGEFRPGTIAGDALIAHELAHVVQQGGASAAAPLGKSAESSGALEADADRSATAAVSSLWAQGAMLGSRVLPAIRSGLRLSRCSKDTSKAAPALTPGKRGTWSISQNNSDGADSSSEYQSVVEIKFDPDPKQVTCDELAFVQNVRLIDTSGKSVAARPNFKNRVTAKGWTIDRLDQNKYGWYAYNNDGSPGGNVTPGKSPKPKKPAELRDKPGWSVPNVVFDFETCAICKGGVDASKVYGCYTWGFDVDGSNKLTSRARTALDGPSAEFTDAVAKWNAQAAGDAAKRNDPDQQPLGPFK